MKKFYILIFSAVFLGASFSSHAQVYNSIADGNPNGYTLDDPRFWVGAQPTNPCNGCTIKIFSNVSMVHCCGVSTSPNTLDSAVFTTQVPSGTLLNDGFGITVGMRFQSSVTNSSINGARFFKVAGMTGLHTALLYDNVGNLLQTADFTNETGSGWQTQDFPLPVSVVAGTTYMIAVYFADGNYTNDNFFFNVPGGIVNGVLSAPGDGLPDPNGVYAYGASPSFPNTSNGKAPNYWVDVSLSGTDGIWLNDVVINNSTINLYGNTNFNVNTYLQLFNSTITLGNNPTSTETIFINDQVFLNGTSSIQLANATTVVNANNDIPNPVVGPFTIPGFPAPIAGVYTIRPAGDPSGHPGVTDLSLTAVANANYNGTWFVSPYILNCDPAFVCAPGLVFGPAITQNDPLATNGFYGFIQSTTLPVQLVKLLATNDGNGGVLISWATSQEQNSAYFDVERSSDQTGWTKIGTVKAKGYSSTTSNYAFTDKLPLDGHGYYHLKMVDLDGKYKFSKTVSVSNGKDNQPLVIYSNPFSDQIRLKVNVSRAQQLTLTVSDMLGKTYISQSYNAQSGDNYVNLHPNVGGSGMYILRIHGDSYEQTAKLEKQ